MLLPLPSLPRFAFPFFPFLSCNHNSKSNKVPTIPIFLRVWYVAVTSLAVTWVSCPGKPPQDVPGLVKLVETSVGFLQLC